MDTGAIISFAVLIVLCILVHLYKNHQQQERFANSPAFLRLLDRATKLKQICRRMPNYCAEHIYNYDFYKVSKDASAKDKYTAMSHPNIYISVHLKDLSVGELLENYYATSQSNNTEKYKYADKLIALLFESKTDYKQFKQLSSFDINDILLNHLDRYPESSEDNTCESDYMLHFPIFCTSQERMTLLSELEKQDNPKKKKQADRRLAKAREVLQNDPPQMQENEFAHIWNAMHGSTGNRQIYRCNCGTKLLAPAGTAHVIVACPKCNEKREFNKPIEVNSAPIANDTPL